jgi:adenylosuccinate synthase
VGSGPFPSEIQGEAADQLRARGNEYGAVTGRPRRCGWVDLPLLRYAQMINGVNWWVVTKLDVLDELKEIPVCVGYKINGKKTDTIPALATGFDQVQCVYEKMPGWKKSTLSTSCPRKPRIICVFSKRRAVRRSAWFPRGQIAIRPSSCQNLRQRCLRLLRARRL